jgi:predicted flap endonuclease-1-like 5' DNA nuclease
MSIYLEIFQTNPLIRYNQTDATLEILIMLAGAFAFGIIARSLFNGRYKSKLKLAEKRVLEMESKMKVAEYDLKQSVQKNETLKEDLSICLQSKQDILKKEGISATAKDLEIEVNQLKEVNLNLRMELEECQSIPRKSFELNREKDDLKQIEGIGPKLESVFNKAGILTFEQLSNSDESRIKQILFDASPNFKFQDAKSWLYQATLAKNGDWKALLKWQEEHKMGKEN